MATLTGCRLHDTFEYHVYTCPAFQLAPGGTVRVWNRSGVNDPANLSWGINAAVWNSAGGKRLDPKHSVAMLRLANTPFTPPAWWALQCVAPSAQLQSRGLAGRAAP